MDDNEQSFIRDRNIHSLRGVRVIERLRASSPDELSEISWWMHDAEFDAATVEVDRSSGVATLSFAQEPRSENEGLPSAVLVTATKRRDEYAVPFLRCRLRIGRATDLDMPRDADAISELLSISYENHRVRVWTNWGEINVPVTTLDVALEVLDEIVSVYRRRVMKPRWLGHADTRWPPEREAEMLDLIRSREGPPLPLHVVSSIVRPPR